MALLITVFILEKTFPNPFFSLSLSFEADGPACEGELMAKVRAYVCVLLDEVKGALKPVVGLDRSGD